MIESEPSLVYVYLCTIVDIILGMHGLGGRPAAVFLAWMKELQ